MCAGKRATLQSLSVLPLLCSRLDGKHLHLLTHLTGPGLIFCIQVVSLGNDNSESGVWWNAMFSGESGIIVAIFFSADRNVCYIMLIKSA